MRGTFIFIFSVSLVLSNVSSLQYGTDCIKAIIFKKIGTKEALSKSHGDEYQIYKGPKQANEHPNHMVITIASLV